MSIDGLALSVIAGVVLTAIGLMLNVAQIPAMMRLFGIAGDPEVRGDARVFAWARAAQSALRTMTKLLLLLLIVGVALCLIGFLQPIAVIIIWTLDLAILLLDIDSMIEVWSRR